VAEGGEKNNNKHFRSMHRNVYVPKRISEAQQKKKLLEIGKWWLGK
jgi:hypothetical protein